MREDPCFHFLQNILGFGDWRAVSSQHSDATSLAYHTNEEKDKGLHVEGVSTGFLDVVE